MPECDSEVVWVLNREEAWEIFLRLCYAAEEDSPQTQAALVKMATALGADWAVPRPTVEPRA